MQLKTWFEGTYFSIQATWSLWGWHYPDSRKCDHSEGIIPKTWERNTNNVNERETKYLKVSGQQGNGGVVDIEKDHFKF